MENARLSVVLSNWWLVFMFEIANKYIHPAAFLFQQWTLLTKIIIATGQFNTGGHAEDAMLGMTGHDQNHYDTGHARCTEVMQWT